MTAVAVAMDRRRWECVGVGAGMGHPVGDGSSLVEVVVGMRRVSGGECALAVVGWRLQGEVEMRWVKEWVGSWEMLRMTV